MVFGYTPLDPLIVLAGTALAIYFISKSPVRLMAWLPAMLTFYFFIPFITLILLSQIVPLMLTARVLYQNQIKVERGFKSLILLMLLAVVYSSCYALISGGDVIRTAIRIIFYVGLIALVSFTYEMGCRQRGYELFLKGLVVTGTVLAAYGLYQLIADLTGLPMRGIVRGTDIQQTANEGGFLRINSLASEPKRLGYVLFVCALACPFYARFRPMQRRKLMGIGLFIGTMSLFTFSGSYFGALSIFIVAALLLHPSRSTLSFLGGSVVFMSILAIFPEAGIYDAIQIGFERRFQEIEVGLDGQKVYRQEFYAWDYLANHPVNALFGVGLGHYPRVFYEIYGVGAGLNFRGNAIYMNSNFLETVFDLGAVFAILFYASIGFLVFKLRKAGETFLCLSLMFLIFQSLTILTLQFVVIFAGVSMARLQVKRRV